MNLYPLFNNNILGIYIIPGVPVLYLKEFDAIVFSDLHLGFEESAARGFDYSYGKKTRTVGMFLPRVQLKRVIEVLNQVLEIIKPRRIIINGDLKHAFDKLLRQEREEIAKLIDFVKNNGVDEVVVIRGNHDNFLPIVLKKYNVSLYSSLEYVSGDYRLLITHGHLDIDPSKYAIIIIGHEHPSIKCFGSIKKPVFMKIPFDKNKYIICLPAVGPYHPGTSISIYNETYLSPIIRKYGDLSRTSIITWIETDDLYLEQTKDIESEPVTIKYFNIRSRRVVLIEFSSIEVALTICGSL